MARGGSSDPPGGWRAALGRVGEPPSGGVGEPAPRVAFPARHLLFQPQELTLNEHSFIILEPPETAVRRSIKWPKSNPKKRSKRWTSPRLRARPNGKSRRSSEVFSSATSTPT